MRKDKPLVSIIIPNYNHADYLEERITSILNQTYTNYEIIILDDKSTDNSIEIINKFRDNSHINNIIINEKNSGSPFKQWFKGISLAKHIAFASATPTKSAPTNPGPYVTPIASISSNVVLASDKAFSIT